MTTLLVLAACLFWALVVGYRKIMLRPASAPTSTDRKTLSPYIVLVASIFSFGLYALYWRFRSTKALKRLSGEQALNPAVDTVLSLMTLGIWGAYADVRNASLLESQSLSQRGYLIVAVFTSIIGIVLVSCGGASLLFIAPALIQHGYNELAQRN